MHVRLEIAHETIFHSVYHSILQRLFRVFWSLQMNLFIRLMYCLKTQRAYFYWVWEIISFTNISFFCFTGRCIALNSITILIVYTNLYFPQQRYVLLAQHDAFCNCLNFCILGTVIFISPKILIRQGAFLPLRISFFSEYRGQNIEIIDLSLLHCIMTSVPGGLFGFGFFLFSSSDQNLYLIWFIWQGQNQHNFGKCDYMNIFMSRFWYRLLYWSILFRLSIFCQLSLDPYQCILDRCKPKPAFGLLFGWKWKLPPTFKSPNS